MKYPHSGVTVRDLERARRFYGELLGLKETWQNRGPSGTAFRARDRQVTRTLSPLF